MAARLKVGDQVEYHSRSQFKWVPTQITAVHSDGTIEVSQKPGVRLDATFVRLPLSPKPSAGFKAGDQVEYHSRSEGKWVPTQVTAVHSDGTVEIARKRGVRLDVKTVRLPSIPRPSGADCRPSATRFKAGDQLGYHSKSQGRWLPSIPRPSGADCRPLVTRFKAGDQVEYHSKSQGRWLLTQVTAVHSDGAIEVARKPGVRLDATSVRLPSSPRRSGADCRALAVQRNMVRITTDNIFQSGLPGFVCKNVAAAPVKVRVMMDAQRSADVADVEIPVGGEIECHFGMPMQARRFPIPAGHTRPVQFYNYMKAFKQASIHVSSTSSHELWMITPTSFCEISGCPGPVISDLNVTLQV